VIRSFITLGLVLIALAGVARADTASEAKKITDAALARYAEAESTGSVMGKIWRLIESAPHENLVQAKDYVVEVKANLDKEVKAGAEVEAEIKLSDLKRAVEVLDTEIADYKSYMKGTLWKLYAGVAFFIILAFGASIWAFIKRKARR
jgi:hypothetical protein